MFDIAAMFTNSCGEETSMGSTDPALWLPDMPDVSLPELLPDVVVVSAPELLF